MTTYRYRRMCARSTHPQRDIWFPVKHRFWALRLPKPTVLEMPLSFVEQLGSVFLSQQGVVGGLLLAAIVYLAWQLATERAARERDRETAKHEAADRTKAVEALALALAKIEGFLGHWGGSR